MRVSAVLISATAMLFIAAVEPVSAQSKLWGFNNVTEMMRAHLANIERIVKEVRPFSSRVGGTLHLYLPPKFRYRDFVEIYWNQDTEVRRRYRAATGYAMFLGQAQSLERARIFDEVVFKSSLGGEPQIPYGQERNQVLWLSLNHTNGVTWYYQPSYRDRPVEVQATEFGDPRPGRDPGSPAVWLGRVRDTAMRLHGPVRSERSQPPAPAQTDDDRSDAVGRARSFRIAPKD